MRLFKRKNPAVAEDLREPCGLSAAPNGDVYILQNIGGWIVVLRADDGDLEDVINTGGNPAGSTVGHDGNLYVADSDKRSILQISPAGDVLTLVETWDNRRLPIPGDLTTHGSGTLFFTANLPADNGNSEGYVFSVTQAGDLRMEVDGLRTPRGIKFAPDGKRLYVSEQGAGRIVSMEVDGEGHPTGAPEPFGLLPGQAPKPAGLAFDAENHLHACLDGSGRVAVLTLTGKVERDIKAPGNRPTSLAFGGSDRRTLYIAEAETGQVVGVKSKTPGV